MHNKTSIFIYINLRNQLPNFNIFPANHLLSDSAASRSHIGQHANFQYKKIFLIRSFVRDLGRRRGKFFGPLFSRENCVKSRGFHNENAITSSVNTVSASNSVWSIHERGEKCVVNVSNGLYGRITRERGEKRKEVHRPRKSLTAREAELSARFFSRFCRFFVLCIFAFLVGNIAQSAGGFAVFFR